MKDYAKTPKGVARKQKYKDTYSKGPATKEIKYPDGSTLHLKMVRNPKFGDQPTNIVAHYKGNDKANDKAKGKNKEEHSTDSKGQQWTCTTDHIQLTASSTTFLNNDYSG